MEKEGSQMKGREFKSIVVTVDGPVATIELNDPEHLNPLDPKTVEAETSRALWSIQADLGIRAVVLTGRGSSFCSGAYIGPPREPSDERDRDRTYPQRLAWGYSFGDFWKTIATFKKPIIAAVNGYALGGGWKLAFVCDMIVAGESAVFGSAEMTVGLTPSPLTAQYLPKMLGKHRAFETFVYSKRFTADEAFALGLVNRVVRDDDCLKVARQLASEIAELPEVAVAFTKQVMNRAFGLDSDYDYERIMAAYLQMVPETQQEREKVKARLRDS